MKFTKTGIELCGKLRKYKRISKGQIKQHQKDVENMVVGSKEIIKQSDELMSEYREAISDLTDIEEMISVIKSKKTPSDEELDRVVDLISQRKAHRDNISALAKQISDFNEKHEETMDSMMDEVPKNLARLASKMVDITEEEFLENYTSDDELLVRYLSFFKQMADAGNTETEMENFWKDLIEKERNDAVGLTPN